MSTLPVLENDQLYSNSNDSSQGNNGRWTQAEHTKFIEGNEHHKQLKFLEKNGTKLQNI